jgi:Protein of unknown function (DUF1439)
VKIKVIHRLQWLFLGVLCLGLTACSGIFGPRSIDISQQQLQEWATQQFPMNNRVLALLDVTLSAPRLTLRPETSRIVTSFDVNVSDLIFKTPHKGTLTVNYSVRFEPSDNTVRLNNVKVERLEIDGAPALMQRQFDRIGLQLAEQAMNDRVAYTLRPKDIKTLQERGYKSGDIRITASGLTLTFQPL